MRKLNQEVSRLKLNFERTNWWTNSSRIVNKLSGLTHNEKASLGFHKEIRVTKDLRYICENIGYPIIECPVEANCRNRSTNMTVEMVLS